MRRTRVTALTTLLGVAVLAAVHARTCGYVVEEPLRPRATYTIKSIRLIGLDDSGTCRRCSSAFTNALTDFVEQLSNDGSTHLVVVTFGSVSRTVFSSPINPTTKPLVLSILKTLAVPDQGYTHPDEALKAFRRELATLFSKDRLLHEAWREGQVTLRVALIWDGRIDLDPRSRTTLADFEREATTLRTDYLVPVVSMVLGPEKSQAKSTAVPTVYRGSIATMNIAPSQLSRALLSQRQSRWDVQVVPPITRSVFPDWLIGLDLLVATGAMCAISVGVVRRNQTRREAARALALRNNAGEWRYSCGTAAGTFALDEHRYAEFGADGYHLQHLPVAFRIYIGSDGVPRLRASRGDILIGHRRIRQGKSITISSPCEISSGEGAVRATVTLRRVTSHRVELREAPSNRLNSDIAARRLA